MKIRRCAVLYIEPREELAIDWSALFAGQSTLAAKTRWVALAPHLDKEIDIDDKQVAALGNLSQTVWRERDECAEGYGAVTITQLLELGLLVSDAAEYSSQRERDETLRAQHWRPLSALAHTFSRWQDVRTETGMQAPSIQALLDSYGPPPPNTFDLG